MQRNVSWFMSFLMLCCLGAAPVRDNVYIENTDIEPDDVMANEDALFTYLQNGVTVLGAGAVATANLQDGAVTSAKIADGTITSSDLAFSLNNQVLPTGAIFFMLSGSCPSWTSDVTSTYSNMFPRVNATPDTTGGSNTHTHDAGSYVGPSHTHTNTDISQAVAWSATVSVGSITSTSAVVATDFDGVATQSGGGGAVTGTSASASNVPAFFTVKACKVN